MAQKLFIFDTHMNTRIYANLLAHCILKRAVLKKAKLEFVGDYCFGYPTIRRTQNNKEKVYGLIVTFTRPDDFEKFENVIKNTRSEWKCEKKKTLVLDEEGNHVKCYLYILEPYLHDRGTRKGRKEVPLKECYDAMLEAYKQHSFKSDQLQDALIDTVKDYYNINI